MKLLLLLSVLLTCLDSLLKMKIGGFHLQAGIIISWLIFSIFILTKPNSVKNVLVSDKSAVIAAVAIALYAFMALDFMVYSTLAMYLAAAYIGYQTLNYFKNDLKFIEKVTWLSIWCLICTGLAQYTLSNFFNFQLTLGDLTADYYQTAFGLRLRGFFLEPNWYGLVLIQWFGLMLFCLARRGETRYPWLMTLSVFLCLLLSDNRLVLLVALGFAFYGYISIKTPKRLGSALLISPYLLIWLAVVFFFAISLTEFGRVFDGDRSASARTVALLKTLGYMVDNFTFGEWITGKGFSNWGYYSNEYIRPPSNYLGVQPLTRRDNGEVYVVLFEMGLVGLGLIIFEIHKILRKPLGIEYLILKLVYASTFICAIFYPLYTFMLYLIPFLIARALLNDQAGSHAK